MLISSSQSWGSAGDLARAGQVFVADYFVTGLAAYSATSGNPLLYNGSGLASGNTSHSKVLAVLLGLGITWTTAPAAAQSIGLGIGVTGAPSSTGTVTAVGNTNPIAQNQVPNCTAYNSGTVTAATVFFGTHQISTGTQTVSPGWIPLDGIIVVPPGGFVCLAGAVTTATVVIKASLVWAEVPI